MRIRDVRRLGCIASVTAAVALVAACSSSTPTPSAPSTCAAAVVPSDQLNRTAEAGGGSLTIPVTAGAGCTWTATSNASFITIASGASGSGNGTVTATVAANSGSQRTGTLSIGSSTVTVTQAGSAPCTFSVSPTTVPMREGAGTASVSVTAAAGCAWTAVSNSTFITVASGASGSGNGTAGISVEANTGAFRTGTLTIAGQTVTVNQDAAGICVTSISPTAQDFGSAGGSGSVNVEAPETCGWQVSSGADFITVVPGTRGNGNGLVTYTVVANTSSSARQGTLSIGGRLVTVMQAGACQVTLSATSLTVGNTATAGSVTVTAASTCGWIATSNAPFITITSGSSGAGPGMVSFNVSANGTGADRTGTLTIGGQLFTVTQQVCQYALSATTVNMGTEGGTSTITVTTSSACTWTASSNAAFISVTSGTLGTGNGSVVFAVQANTSFTRSGSLTIAGQTVTVNQTGSGFDNCIQCITRVNRCDLTPGIYEQTFGADGGNQTLRVFAPDTCTWQLSATGDFVTISGATTGFGNGQTSYIVAPNAGASRTGAVTGGGKTFTVRQDACTYTVSPGSINVASTGATVSVTVAPDSSVCPWSATSNAGFITIASGSTGTGNGTVTFSVATNGGATRTGTLTIAGRTVTVTQSGS